MMALPAMTVKAAADTAAVLAAYDFGRFDTIADVGGGARTPLPSGAGREPTAEGIPFDLPDVVAALEIDRDRLAGRSGDFLVIGQSVR